MKKRVDPISSITRADGAGAAKKRKRKTAIRYAVLAAVAIIAYAASFFANGFYETNKKLVTLVIASASGFLLFFAAYGAAYGITVAVLRKKRKNSDSAAVLCDDEFYNIASDEKYSFKYDTKKKLNENVFVAFEKGKTLVSDIAAYKGIKSKYYYLDYTVYDAVDIIGDVIDVIKFKIDGIFVFFRLQDKPLGFVEKSLLKLVDDERKEEKTEKTNAVTRFFTGVKRKVADAGIKAGLFVFQSKINATADEIIEFAGQEAFRVLKKHKKAAKSIKNEKRELISEAALTESFGDFENNANGDRESDNDD